MEFLTAQELAKELKVTVDTIWRHTRTGRIPFVRLGIRDYRYRLPEVLEALAAAPSIANPLASPSIVLHPTDPDRLRAFAGESHEGGLR